MRKKSNASPVPRRGMATWKGLACLSLLAALVACGPRATRDAQAPSHAPSRAPQEAPQPPVGSKQPAEPAVAPAPPPAPPPAPAASTAAPPAEKPKPAPPPTIAQPRAFGLASAAGPILPEDFAIGPLQDLRPARLDEKAAAEAATVFLGSLLEGKLAASVVLPERLALLEALLSPFFAGERPVSYRLGAIDFSEGLGGTAAGRAGQPEASAVASVALFNAEGAAGRRAAEIALRRDGASWRVESFQATAPAAAGKAGAESGAFEPRLRRPEGSRP